MSKNNGSLEKSQTWNTKALATALKPYAKCDPDEPVFVEIRGRRYNIGDITETGHECVLHAKTPVKKD